PRCWHETSFLAGGGQCRAQNTRGDARVGGGGGKRGRRGPTEPCRSEPRGAPGRRRGERRTGARRELASGGVPGVVPTTYARRNLPAVGAEPGGLGCRTRDGAGASS